MMSQHQQITGGGAGWPALVLAASVATAGGCQSLNAPLYFMGQELMATAGDDPPVSNGVTLHFRNPTRQEQQALDAQTAALNYGGDVPWIALDKVHVEVSYQITNTTTNAGSFNLLVDGASQFEKYDSKTVAAALQQGNNNPPTYLPLMQSHPQVLAGGATFTGLLREDDFAEAALDLDALGRWNDAATKTFAAVLLNRSDVNPVGLELVPKNLVTPALMEVDVNLQVANSESSMGDAVMKLDYVVRVRDDDDRLLHDDGDALFQPTPTLFAPTTTKM